MNDHVHLNPSFDDLPLLRLPSYMYPSHDGDIAWLHELCDRVFEYRAGDVATLKHRHIYHQVQHATGIYPRQLVKNWDSVSDMLRRWRNE